MTEIAPDKITEQLNAQAERERFLTVDQCARMTMLTERTIQHHIAKGNLPAETETVWPFRKLVDVLDLSDFILGRTDDRRDLFLKRVNTRTPRA